MIGSEQRIITKYPLEDSTICLVRTDMHQDTLNIDCLAPGCLVHGRPIVSPLRRKLIKVNIADTNKKYKQNNVFVMLKVVFDDGSIFFLNYTSGDSS